MGRTRKISESDAQEIRKKMSEVKKVSIYKKLEAVALLGEGKTLQEISEITGYNAQYVGRLGCEFNEKGLEAFAVENRKGGNHQVMTDEEASEFLTGFEDKARKGQIITINEIAEAFDKATGKKRSSLSTIYYFLHSHGWRTVMPRSKHPKKASDEEIASSKKLTLESKN